MGRQSSNSAEYFVHDAKPGRTLFILERRWGNDGYAFWFKLLEVLASSKGHFFPHRNDQDREYFRARMNLSEGISDADILDLLAELGNIDKPLWSERGIIWCQALVDRLASTLYAKRKCGPPQKPSMDGNISGAEIPPETDIRVGNLKNCTSEGISGESIHRVSERVRERASDAEGPPAAASFLSLLKKSLASAGIELAPADLEACASRLIAASADSPAFVAFAVDKCRRAKQRGTWFVKGCLEWDWIAKWRENGKLGKSLPSAPAAPAPLPLYVDRTPEEEAKVELETARVRRDMRMPMSDRQRELLGLPAPPAAIALTAEQPSDDFVDDFPEEPREGGTP